MYKIFLGLLLGVILGGAAYWYLAKDGGDPVKKVTQKVDETVSVIQDQARDAKDQFNVESMKQELAKTGSVIREKAQVAGKAVADSAANAKITAVIKAKLAAEKNLSSIHIGVDTTDGLVTLSGKVSSVDELSRAVKIAYDTDGVMKVMSTLQVSKN